MGELKEAQAMLPADYFERTIIGRMEPGDLGWVPSTALWVGIEGEIYLNGDVVVFPYARGKVNMLVQRTALGWEVAAPRDGESWHRRSKPPHGQRIPVRRVRW